MATYPTQPIPAMPPFDPPKADPEELKVPSDKARSSGEHRQCARADHQHRSSGYDGGNVFAAWGESGEATIK